MVRFVRNPLGNVSEFFSDNISRGQKTSASHGVMTHSIDPFGYQREYRMYRRKMRPFLVPDPDTAPVVQRMFGLYLDGSSTSKIASIFREEDVPGPTEKPWTPKQVSQMLKNITYAGFIRFGQRSKYEDEASLTAVPEMEIVSLEDYNRVQEIMASRNPANRHPREIASVHLC